VMHKGAESVRVAHPLFQAERGGSTPTSALDLRFYPTDLTTARNLNRLWHSRLPRYGSPQCRQCYVAEYDGLYYAVAIWQRPIASHVPQYEWLELSRMAIASDAPKNTASRMLAWMARDITKKLPGIARLISYQDCEVNAGTIYKAAGWKATTLSRGNDWNRSCRYRRPSQTTAPKQRWEKELHAR
jgi:hypothetical protein